jgi:magnesium-transporting ATPase (P-type)
LVLLGLIGLLDLPHKKAVEAVKECHGGGIRITMITGDHKITAAAIAKMLGNDAPPLKKADIGVAMGIKGTEVTTEAAESSRGR